MKARSLQRILVTGGAGFIGSHTVDLLLSENKEVLVLDDLSSGKLENLNLNHPNLEFIEGNVLEYPFLEEIIANCDAVLHLAAIVSVPESIENPILTLKVNTQGVLHVLQAVHKIGRPIRVVQASSAAVYGEAELLPCNDELPLPRKSLSPYALQKIHAEDYADLYQRLFGVKSLQLRYFNVYGRRQDANSPYSGVIVRFLDAYRKNEELIIFGDGHQSRDFIHVSDVAKANWLALQNNYTGVLNIATGKPHSLLQLVNYMQKVGGQTALLNFQPQRSGDIRTSYAAVQLAKITLGFTYSISLQEGMELMLSDTALAA